jgi:hypothetical protein
MGMLSQQCRHELPASRDATQEDAFGKLVQLLPHTINISHGLELLPH